MVASPKKMSFFKPALIIFIVIAIPAAFKFSIFKPKPNIAVDYLSQYNELTKPANYDPDQNCAELYGKALQRYIEIPNVLSNSMSLLNCEEAFIMPDDFDDKMLNKLTVWVDDNRVAVDYIQKAAEKSYYWREFPDVDNGLAGMHSEESFEYTYKYCLLSDTVLWWIKIDILKNPEAILNIKQNFKMAEMLADVESEIYPSLASDIWRDSFSTIRSILKHKIIETNILTQLQCSLEETDVTIPVGKLYDARSLMALDVIQRIFTDDGNGDGVIIPSRYKRIVYGDSGGSGIDWSDLSSLLDNLKYAFDDYRDEIKNTKKIKRTSETRKEAVDSVLQMCGKAKNNYTSTPFELKLRSTSYKEELYEDLNTFFREHPITVTLLFIDYIMEFNHETKCEHNATTAVVAIFRYKQEKGFLPDTLDELVDTGYLKSLPMDIFSGGSIVYRHGEDDFVLYSVGRDFDDDGGTSDYDWESKSGDWLFWPVPEPEKIEPLPGMMPGEDWINI